MKDRDAVDGALLRVAHQFERDGPRLQDAAMAKGKDCAKSNHAMSEVDQLLLSCVAIRRRQYLV